MGKFNADRQPLTYLITGGETTDANFHEEKRTILHLIECAVETKISLIQIREKRLSARMVFELATEAVKLTAPTATKLLINDRADIAFAANADGVHLPAESLPANIIKRAFPPDFIVGVSAHTLEEAVAAEKQEADFVTFSPIFFSLGKGAPQGISRLRQICEHLKSFPVIALGGIDESNLAAVLAAGASGFAAIRFLNSAENLRKISQRIHK